MTSPRISPSGLLRTLVCAGVLTTFASVGEMLYESKQLQKDPNYKFPYTIPDVPYKLFEVGFAVTLAGMIAGYRQDKPTIYSLKDTSISPEKSSFTLSDWFNSAENSERITKEKSQVQAQTSNQKQ